VLATGGRIKGNGEPRDTRTDTDVAVLCPTE
jgi:hypothetical protein